jgi:dihydrofolate reductase
LLGLASALRRRKLKMIQGGGFCGMAKLFFGMNLSLDGYVDHQEFAPPGPALFRHFIEQVRDLAGSVYGRRIYEVMRYWDEDRPEWATEQRDFAAAWRRQPKWVVSRSLTSVGPNATLVEGDIEAVARGLKARLLGEIQVAGPDLARSLTDLGLIDEYRLYFRPFVLGRGKPFFAGPRPPLRLVAHDRIGEDAIRLTYVPA